MSRPFSDAQTTFMPELHPVTVPLHVALLCGWCAINLAAVPDTPAEWRGRFYHPRCVTAAWRSAEPDQSGTVVDTEGAA